MVNGSGFNEAVQIARDNPRLGVGLHLSLVCGRSALKPTEIPGLVDNSYSFSNRPVLSGFRYFALPSLRRQLRQEIHAQFQKFHRTGLKLDHVNGHLHLHLHPTVFSILKHHAAEWGVTRVRLTRDPFWLNARLAPGRWFYRATHFCAFALLSLRAQKTLKDLQLRHTDRVFGLLQDGEADEDYVTGLIPRLPPGDSELYSHPSLDEFKHEFDALVSPRVAALIREHQIQLLRYQDL